MTSAGPNAVEAREAATAAGDKRVGAEEQGSTKRAYVRRIFSEIAPRYDLLNHVLSLNIDRSWRSKAVDALEWKRAPSGTYLDLCAGTLDVSLNLAARPGFAGRVVASDFATPMLRVALPKIQRLSVLPVTADALSLPLVAGSVDGAIIAFGARNLADLDAGIAEVLRVLKPGARLVILEFSTPANALVRGAYHAYFHHVLPFVGRVISGHRTAYSYLPASVSYFPSVDELARRLTRAGYTNVRYFALTFGIATIHVADKA
jgi:demethylmenaquinone methyltransferase/2-methoxy-6-polyprenyl-1,4-benzoquinol methylase